MAKSKRLGKAVLPRWRGFWEIASIIGWWTLSDGRIAGEASPVLALGHAVRVRSAQRVDEQSNVAVAGSHPQDPLAE